MLVTGLLLVTAAVLLALVWHWYRDRLTVSDITHKCVFITGCDSGFGRALALRLDSRGVPVFAGCLTTDGATSLLSAVSKKLKVIRVDVTKPSDIQAAFDFIKSMLPNNSVLWGIVNNAGLLGTDGPTEFFTSDDYRNIWEVNFLGMTQVVDAFLPLLKKSSGRIVNMCSQAGHMAIPRLAPYVASKHAVMGYSDALRLEKSVWGILVSTVFPGGHRTGILNPEIYMKAKQQQWDRLSREIQEQYGEQEFKDACAGWVKWPEVSANSNIDGVLNVYQHGLFAVHPKSHYYPDRESKTMYMIYLLPRWVMDRVLSQFVRSPNFMPRALKTKDKSH